MAEFSATDAAFEGFRVTRERPKAVLMWGLVYVVTIGAILALIFGVLGAGFLEAMGDEDPSEEELRAIFTRLLPLLFLVLPVALALSAVILAAIYRAILRPADDRNAYLRLGGDELRLLLLMVIMTVLWIVLILALVAAVVALYQVAAPLGVLAGFAAVGVAIWVGVRLSLAPPMTFAQGRLEIFGSWRVTQGRFWPLLGTYVLAIVMAFLISLLAGIISSAVLAIFGGGLAALSQANSPDFASMGAGFAVGFTLYILIQLIAAVLQLVVQSSPAAAAYRDITGYGRNTAEVFS